MHTITGSAGALVQSEKCLRLVKAFQVWEGAFTSSANDNKPFVIMSRSVGYVLSDQFMVPVKEKVHEKQSINEQLLCSVLVLANKV